MRRDREITKNYKVYLYDTIPTLLTFFEFKYKAKVKLIAKYVA